MFLDLICTSNNKNHRQGYPVGKLLLAKFEQLAKKFNYNKLKGTSVKNAINFYKKMGWTINPDNSMAKKI